jgi:hypothetical protein
MHVNTFYSLSEAAIFEFMGEVHDEEDQMGQLSNDRQASWL